MLQVNISDAPSNFSQWLNRALAGEEIVIIGHNKPVAKLVPVNGAKSKRRIGTAKGKIKIADDFDAPSNDFREYMP